MRASREAGLWIGGVLLSSSVPAAVWLLLGLPSPGCRFRDWTGLPCATCGTTRMLLALLGGDVASAILFNPMMFLVLALLVAWSIRSSISAITGRPTRPIAQSPRPRRALVIAAAIALVAGWAYQIWRGV